MSIFSSLLTKQTPKQSNNSDDPHNAAWQRYHAAFSALERAFGFEARAQAIAECEAATKHLLSVRRKSAGMH